MTYRFLFFAALAFGISLWLCPAISCNMATPQTESPSITIMCYMNGDNDLAEEVLHALDMMETVGSSDNVRIIALVDGHEQWLGPYAAKWAGTRLLHVEAYPQIGSIQSTVLEEWDEANLGNPDTLERFIRTVLMHYPADRYFFYTFAHSQGIIDTRRFSAAPTQGVKALSISRDRTSNTTMHLEQFAGAIKRGLDGKRFDLMVLFSCLANMVEVGYALAEVTDFLVGSEDEIRLLNRPSGTYQIRGLPFEKTIHTIKKMPAIDARQIGRMMVDNHVADYGRDVIITLNQGAPELCRYSGGMALVDCKALPTLVAALDHLARYLISYSDDPTTLTAMKNALSKTQRFASFLNLEYYDLQTFVQQLRTQLNHPKVIEACDQVIEQLVEKVIIYERHTADCNAYGMSVYLSNPLVPENIYKVHHTQYTENRFSRETQWDEMIDIYRKRLKP